MGLKYLAKRYRIDDVSSIFILYLVQGFVMYYNDQLPKSKIQI